MRTSIKITVAAFVLSVVGCIPKTETKVIVETPTLVEIATVSESIPDEKRRSVVFITGYDAGSKTYYADAKEFFSKTSSEIVETAYSLQEIILWMNINYNNNPFDEIHIVNNNKLNEMSLETTIKGANITVLTLKNSVENGSLPKLENVLAKNAKLVFHASGLGSNIELMNAFKQVFTTDVQPTIIASENISVFGSEFAPQYLAKPHYGYYPTANSPGRVDLAKQFSKSYPNANIDWLSAMNNSEERFQGDVYSYKFNVPVRWDIEFSGDDEIPSFNTTEELILWMKDNDEISAELETLGVPIEKYRWYQTVKNDTLIIKGKATVICVLEPVMSAAYPSEYMIPSIDNLRLYDSI